MEEMLFIYSGATVFYAHNENQIILMDYCRGIGEEFIKFLESDDKSSPYSFLAGYKERQEELRGYFKDFLLGLTCEGLSFLDLKGNKVNKPHPFELLKQSDEFKKAYTIKHLLLEKNGCYQVRIAYVIDNIWDALFIELIKLIESGKLFRKCENCNSIFFPKDRAEKYCDRLVDNVKTCKDVGYLNKIENDKILKAYNTAYKTRHAEKQRKIRGKSKSTVQKYDDALKIWREDARVALREIQEGNISINKYKKTLSKTLEEIVNMTKEE